MKEYHRRHLDDLEIHRRWLDPRLGQVRVADVVAYLRGKGWQSVPTDRSGDLVFAEPAGSSDGPLYQWVPEDEKRRDFAARMYELIAALAEVEDRWAGDVLSDILRLRNGLTPANGPQVATVAES